MSKSTDKEIPSTGAVPKTGQNKNKGSKNKNKYPETKIGTGLQTVSGDFENDWSKADQDIGPESAFEVPSCKRRHKCVTFILEDECNSKKSKDDPVAKIHESRVFKNSLMKKQKRNWVSKDEGNRADDERKVSTSSSTLVSKEPQIIAANKAKQDVKVEIADEYKEKDATKTEGKNCAQKRKKPKCPKRSTTASRDVNNEPIDKIRKESISEDELTSELANLHIGPDRNYLQNLLEDMVPARPKLKKKRTHDRKVSEAAVQTDINSNVSNDFNLKKVIKWTRKRWNKDRKAASIVSTERTSVVIHNLPMTMISVYDQKLTEVFEKLGRIKRIGSAEVLPETDGEVFNTTIYFETEEAATKALDEDFCLYGSRVRVSRPLPPTETTAVARSYSQLPTAELRAAFGGAGPLRCVHAGQRRSGRMTVAFLEFDGPEAVQRALALSGAVKVNGKPVYVNKFEIREKDRWPGDVGSNSTSPILTV